MAKSNQTPAAAPTQSQATRQPSQHSSEKKKGGCGCCMGKLFALFLMLVMIGVITWFAWRYVQRGRLQDKLADYGARGEVFGAEHLNQLYQGSENSQEITRLLYLACDNVSTGNFESSSAGLPFVSDGEIPPLSENYENSQAADLSDEYRKSADQLRKIGELGGEAYIPIDFSTHTGLDRESSQMLEAGFNFLTLDTLVQIQRGNAELVAANVKTALGYSKSISKIPSNDQYLRFDYDKRALDLMIRAIANTQFTIEQLNDFDELLDDHQYRDGLKRMVTGAKVMGNQFFVDPASYYETHLKSGANDLPQAIENQQRVENYMKYSPFVFEDHMAFLTEMEKYDEALLELPWLELRDALIELKTEQEQTYSESMSDYRFPYTKQLLPDFADYIETAHSLGQFRQLIRGALAVKRYEAGEGRLPQFLNQIPPKYADEIPQDPYSDGPLLMQFVKDQVVIYSVGPDGKDDLAGMAGQGDDIRIVLPKGTPAQSSGEILDL